MGMPVVAIGAGLDKDDEEAVESPFALLAGITGLLVRLDRSIELSKNAMSSGSAFG